MNNEEKGYCAKTTISCEIVVLAYFGGFAQ
jgi:hypothetical protein